MAIINRFSRALKAKSIKRYMLYAFGEVLLIFTGITLSVWFTNWNEDRKEKTIEINILREIREGLVHDTLDLYGNIEVRERAKHACGRILGFMESNAPYNDSATIYFAYAYQFAGFLATTSAYQNLESRGLNTITNDSLRARIITLYDIGYDWMVSSEERHSDFFFNLLVPFNSTRFKSTNPYDKMLALDYDDLMRDKEYKYYLNVLIFYNDFQLNMSKSLLKEIRNLITDIDIELKKGKKA